MLEDFERLIRQVSKTSQQLARVFDEVWGHGPKVSIQETENTVKLHVESPPNQQVKRWAVRVVDDTVFLKGHYTAEITIQSDLGGHHHERRSEEFMKAIHVPCPIEAQPASAKKDGQTLTLTFQKLKKRSADGWVDLEL